MKRRITLPEDESLTFRYDDGGKPKTRYPAARRSLVEAVDNEAVGTICMTENGIVSEFAVTLRTVLDFGRHPDCDIVLECPRVSSRHLSVFGIGTATGLPLAVVHDTSSNGYYINDQWHGVNKVAPGGMDVVSKNALLRDGDVLRLSGCEAVFQYVQRVVEASLDGFFEETNSKIRLFPDHDPSREKTLYPFTIHNYPLGSGAWGIVNLGTHVVRKDLQFAIKTVSLRHPVREKAKLLEELRIHRKLDHPNIMRLIDYVKEKEKGVETRMHLVLDLVIGGDLWAYAVDFGPLEESEVRWVGLQLVKGLRYMHEKEVVHRDIKPENILVLARMPYPRLVITDLGAATTRNSIIASLANGSGRASRYKDVGTPSYLPPEHLEGFAQQHNGPQMGDLGPKVRVGTRWFHEQCGMDVWALGVTLWFCAACSHPFRYRWDEEQDEGGEWRAYGDGARDETVRPAKKQRTDELVDDPIASFDPGDEDEILEDSEELQVDEDEDEFGHELDAPGYTGDPSEPHYGYDIDDENESKGQPLFISARGFGDETGLAMPMGDMNLWRSSTIRPGTEGRADTTMFSPSWRGRQSAERGMLERAELLARIRSFAELETGEWPRQSIWSEWSASGMCPIGIGILAWLRYDGRLPGVQFIRECLIVDVGERIQMHRAEEHEWFVEGKEQLDAIYDKVVVNGQVVRGLFGR